MDVSTVARGIFRFVIGLGKKVLLANGLGALADGIWSTTNLNLTVGAAWLGIFAYTLQIYFDFGGYSDMAIGLGEMMGFHFMENFNYPYLSKSISEFWRRWHISLGSWFRDYVYFSMGGSRVTRGKLLRNTLVVWAITGLWHGANWTFLLWGIYYGILISGEKLLKLDKIKVYSWVRYGICLLFVMVGWVLFRADSIGQAISYVGKLLGIGTVAWINQSTWLQFHDNFCLLVLAVLGATPLVKWGWRKLTQWLPDLVASGLQGLVTLGILSVSTIYLVNATYNPFIYFRF